MQATSLCQPQDKASLPGAETPRRSSLRIVNVKSPIHSKEDEGLYLSRAATYIRERMDRRSSAGDAFVPRARKDPPDKPLDSDAGQHNQGIVSKKMTGVMLRSPVNHSPASEDTSLPIVKIRGDKDELPIEAAEALCPKDMELAHRVLEGPKPPEAAINLFQWRGQEAISSENSSVFLHSREPAAALTPPTPTPAVSPARSHPRSSTELELWLRWKPPDKEEDSGRLACYAVKETKQMSVTEHSPIYGIATTPFAVPPARQEWAETRLLLNVEIIWRTRRKPPNNSQRPSARIISAGDNTKAEHSPACEPAYPSHGPHSRHSHAAALTQQSPCWFAIALARRPFPLPAISHRVHSPSSIAATYTRQ